MPPLPIRFTQTPQALTRRGGRAAVPVAFSTTAPEELQTGAQAAGLQASIGAQQVQTGLQLFSATVAAIQRKASIENAKQKDGASQAITDFKLDIDARLNQIELSADPDPTKREAQIREAFTASSDLFRGQVQQVGAGAVALFNRAVQQTMVSRVPSARSAAIKDFQDKVDAGNLRRIEVDIREAVEESDPNVRGEILSQSLQGIADLEGTILTPKESFIRQRKVLDRVEEGVFIKAALENPMAAFTNLRASNLPADKKLRYQNLALSQLNQAFNLEERTRAANERQLREAQGSFNAQLFGKISQAVLAEDDATLIEINKALTPLVLSGRLSDKDSVSLGKYLTTALQTSSREALKVDDPNLVRQLVFAVENGQMSANQLIEHLGKGASLSTVSRLRTEIHDQRKANHYTKQDQYLAAKEWLSNSIAPTGLAKFLPGSRDRIAAIQASALLDYKTQMAQIAGVDGSVNVDEVRARALEVSRTVFASYQEPLASSQAVPEPQFSTSVGQVIELFRKGNLTRDVAILEIIKHFGQGNFPAGIEVDPTDPKAVDKVIKQLVQGEGS
jgi:hypothetical protein